MLIVSLEYGFLAEIEAHIVFFVCVCVLVVSYSALILPSKKSITRPEIAPISSLGLTNTVLKRVSLTLLRTVFVSPSGEIGAISGRVIDFLEGSIRGMFRFQKMDDMSAFLPLPSPCQAWKPIQFHWSPLLWPVHLNHN